VSPYLIHWGSHLVSEITRRFPETALSLTAKAIIASIFYLAAACFATAGLEKYSAAQWRIIVDPRVYPVAAVRFMKKNNFSGNLILPFEWGEYAIWKLYPACRVSIDGRFRTAYPESVIRDHFKARKTERLFTRLAEKYPADIILAHQTPSMNFHISRNNPDWPYVYSDPVAVIFIRNSSRNRTLLESFKAKDFIYPRGAPSPFFP